MPHQGVLAQVLHSAALFAALAGANHSSQLPSGTQNDKLEQCSDVTLHAAYLAEERRGQGSGFFLQIQNKRNRVIAVPDPVPLSVHWYAAKAGQWLWRSSSGSGGSLVNARRERGPLFAARAPRQAAEPVLRTIAAGSTYSWTIFSSQAPALQYHPGCERCNYQGEEQFRAVLAYAYLPASDQEASSLLNCGLRSNPVVMPPLTDPKKPHNSPMESGFP